VVRVLTNHIIVNNKKSHKEYGKSLMEKVIADEFKEIIIDVCTGSCLHEPH
jgi:hypothetical protein